MASQVYAFAVTVTAGTSESDPQVTDIAIPPSKVSQVDFVIPPGPSGLMGFALTMAGNTVVPINDGAYIVTDDEHISWQLTDLPDSGAWQLTAYNTDVFDHTVYVRLHADPAALQPVPSLTLIDSASLSQAAG